MGIRLIVNADDYGHAASVCAGIRQAHLHGIVTSTTAMLNRPGVEAELETALRDCPGLGLGVHLTITTGRPLLPPARLPSLTRLADGERFPTRAELVRGLAHVDPDEVLAEWHAQVGKFVRITGRPPDHLDSHHHSSYFSPALFERMVSLARQYNCPIRNPFIPTLNFREAIGDDLPPVWPEDTAALSQQLKAIAAGSVRWPDRFEGGFYDAAATTEKLEAIIASLPDGVTELMCHPALADETLAAVTAYNRQRAVELAVLTQPHLPSRLSAGGVELVTFEILR